MADKTITITQSFAEIDAPLYYTVSFELPENVESFVVKYSYKRGKVLNKETGWNLENTVDIALAAPDGMQIGASASSRETIYISAAYSTYGYKRFAPVAGTYSLLVGLYRKVFDFEATYTIEYTLKHPRWLAGDPHLHTLNSDGKFTPEEIIVKCQKRGLDWIIFTDHNNTCANAVRSNKPGFLVIPGMELTGYIGHVNLWGVDEPIRGMYAFNDFERLQQLLDEAKSNGATVSVNHPHCKECGWHMPLEIPMDCLEVWNGIMRIDNMTTLQWWHEQLLKGNHLPAVGGSDYHQDYLVSRLLAVPTTHVYAQANAPRDILDALKHGRAVITQTPTSTMPMLFVGDKTIGDTARLADGQPARVEVKGLKRGHTLYVYNNDEIIYKYKARARCNHIAELPALSKGFIRAEVKYHMSPIVERVHQLIMSFFLPPDSKLPVPDFLWAMTNPIWLE